MNATAPLHRFCQPKASTTEWVLFFNHRAICQEAQRLASDPPFVEVVPKQHVQQQLVLTLQRANWWRHGV
ncbi:MAG: hypothetical protein SFZ03_11375 [Candidatus Melainabacteria bacterium]|nr:hypothetical protein [Candidatus Melainabacteria bacterium]